MTNQSKLQIYQTFNNNLITSQAIRNSPHSPSSSSQTAQQTPTSIPPAIPTSIPTLNLNSQEELATRVKVSLKRALLKQFQIQNAYKHPTKKARNVRTVAGQAFTEKARLNQLR